MELTFKRGIRDGIPIALGYFAVSFAFGVSVINQGLPALLAVIMSLTNVTSAGQFAGAAVVAALGSVMEIVLTQVVINARYFLMSLTLSQRLEKGFRLRDRFFCSFGITDEVFGVAVSRKQAVNARYMYGLICLPILFWTLGTAVGALAGNFLPEIIMQSLGIALYAMFIAIIVPAGLRDRKIFVVSLIAVALSCGFYYLPFLSGISSGTAYIICALAASTVGALVFPVKDEGEEV